MEDDREIKLWPVHMAIAITAAAKVANWQLATSLLSRMGSEAATCRSGLGPEGHVDSDSEDAKEGASSSGKLYMMEVLQNVVTNSQLEVLHNAH